MTLPSLVEALRQPGIYPGRPAEVQLVQTHISYVFLAGDEVFKIKKPVRFPFLDFSTRHLRRHFCHEEVRLNRRLAPAIYRGVLSLRPDGAGFRLSDEDDPDAVEYLVQMRRLPAQRILAHLLDENGATTAMIDALAERLVEFHARASCASEVTAQGHPAFVGRVIEDNFASVAPFRGRTVEAEDDDAIRAFSRDFLDREVPLFSRRQAERRIREGHGDLHAEHICFTEPLVIFDCIEFNRRFRYCDVASEIAFAAMDLDRRGRPELARHLVERYAALAVDPELPRLTPFYQCYRAYVRGKVESLTSAEEEIDPSERESAARRAARYFELSYRYTWAFRPALVVTAGLSGTGKSTLARALRERTGFEHLNSDAVRKELAGMRPAHRPRPADVAALYSPAMSARTYAELYARARRALAAGGGAILDATFQRREDREAARALAAEYDVPFAFVECVCPEEEVRRRLRARSERDDDPSDAGWEVYLQQRAQRVEPAAGDLLADTTWPRGDLCRTIEAALRAGR